MIKLKLKLEGGAEKKFQEMLDWSNVDKEKIAHDAFGLLHHIMQEVRLGRMGYMFVQQDKTVQRRHLDALWTIEYPPQCKCSKKKK